MHAAFIHHAELALVQQAHSTACHRRSMSRQAVRAAVDKCLSAVGMQDFVHAPTGSLSGGQKQRVTLAGALAQEAQVHLATLNTRPSE